MKLWDVHIDPRVYLFWALLLLTLPLKWVAAFLIASVWHEAWHYLTLKSFHFSVNSIKVGLTGVQMEIPCISRSAETICALAGPMGGLLLLLFYRRYPELSICALAQSVYNLLPIYPLDGGRALRCAAEMVFRGQAAKVCLLVEILTLCSVFYVCFSLQWGLPIVVGCVYLLGKWLRGKTPCKPMNIGVQ